MNKNKVLKKIFLLLTTLFIFNVNFLSNAKTEENITKENSSKFIQKIENGEIDWGNRIIKVKGKGVAPNTGSLTNRRLKARIAARSDAYRNIAKITGTVQVTSQKSISNVADGECSKDENCENKKASQAIIKTRIEGVIRGARQIGEEKIIDDNTVEVELYVPIFGNGSLAYALDLGKNINKYNTEIQNELDESQNKKSMLYDSKIYLASLGDFFNPKIANNDEITGLIIDATGLGVEPAMAPFLIAGAKIIYTGAKVTPDPENIVKYGITEYTESIDKAKENISRVGKNPLIAEARAALGKPNRTNLLLDDLSIKKIMEANEKYNFLTKLAVVIVI
ncbi:MAG: hypothetical protein U0457_11210 [Candidatus Sericytochromatia bacterium]